jgi:hypothetical protein
MGVVSLARRKRALLAKETCTWLFPIIGSLELKEFDNTAASDLLVAIA